MIHRLILAEALASRREFFASRREAGLKLTSLVSTSVVCRTVARSTEPSRCSLIKYARDRSSYLLDFRVSNSEQQFATTAPTPAARAASWPARTRRRGRSA